MPSTDELQGQGMSRGASHEGRVDVRSAEMHSLVVVATSGAMGPLSGSPAAGLPVYAYLGSPAVQPRQEVIAVSCFLYRCPDS